MKSIFDQSTGGDRMTSGQKSIRITVGIGLLALLYSMGSTLAANINIGSSASEFGQGIQVTTACDSQITVTPQAAFNNSATPSPATTPSTTGVFYLSSIKVTNIDSSANGCDGKWLTLKSFDSSSSSPLQLIDGVFTFSVLNTAGVFSSTQSGFSVTTHNTSSFTISFTTPVALSRDITRVTIETSNTSMAPALVSYSVGDVGPAGGMIFYVANTPFACGPTLNLNCTYLEAAPKTWSGGATDGTGNWCQDDALIAGTGTAIGTGRANTNIIATNCAGSSITKTLQTLTLGGKTDWFLPSSGEANEFFVQKLLFTGNFALSGSAMNTDPARYLSSSQDRAPGNPLNMQYVSWLSGGASGGWKVYAGFSVRPVRAF